MNAAIVRKTLRDSLGLLLLLALAAVAFEMIIVVAFDELLDDFIRTFLDTPFIRTLISTLLGAEVAETITPAALKTVGLAHPVLYALMWTLLLTVCTRVTVGELDRGTAELLLTLPVSRAGVYASVSLAVLFCATAISAAPLCGMLLGNWLFPSEDSVSLGRLSLVAVNLLALNLAVSGVAFFVSSLLSRRGLAVGIVLGLLVASFFLSFLAQTWPPAGRISFLGLLHYYQPLRIVRDGAIPPYALLTLTGFAVVTWSAGLWHFRRRDIPAV